MNPHFTGLNLIFLDKCCTSWERNRWLTWMPFAFWQPLSALWFVLRSLFYKWTFSPCLAKKNQSVFMCRPSVLLVVSVRACKRRTTRRGEWFDCLSVWNKNTYIEKHGRDIQSDACKLSLGSKWERHMLHINNSLGCDNKKIVTTMSNQGEKMITISIFIVPPFGGI